MSDKRLRAKEYAREIFMEMATLTFTNVHMVAKQAVDLMIRENMTMLEFYPNHSYYQLRINFLEIVKEEITKNSIG